MYLIWMPVLTTLTEVLRLSYFDDRATRVLQHAIHKVGFNIQIVYPGPSLSKYVYRNHITNIIAGWTICNCFVNNFPKRSRDYVIYEEVCYCILHEDLQHKTAHSQQSVTPTEVTDVKATQRNTGILRIVEVFLINKMRPTKKEQGRITKNWWKEQHQSEHVVVLLNTAIIHFSTSSVGGFQVKNS